MPQAIPVPDTCSELALWVQLAARWAELLGVLPLYPDGNARVASGLARLRAAIDALQDGRDLTFRFQGELLLAGDEYLQVKPGSKLAWLKERFDRGMLAGLGLARGVCDESLAGFSRRLVENFVRRSTARVGFPDLWPEEFAGLQLIPRRFEGTFEERAASASGARGGGGVAPGLVEHLCADPGVQRALRNLRSSGGERSARGVAVRPTELIEGIVRHLPAEAALDRELATELTRATLGRLGGPPEEADDGLLRLVSRVGRSYFGRSVEDLAAPRTQARPEQGQLRPPSQSPEAELELFELELLALDPQAPVVRRELVDRSSEQLGVYLHVFATVGDPRKLPGLEQGFARLLANPQPEDLAVMRQFLTGSGPVAQQGRDRIAAELRRRGETRWIRTCGALDAGWAVREFPWEFFDFVDSFDLARPEEATQLLDVCAQIGNERIERGLETLAKDRRLLVEAFTRFVFADRSGTLLPIARRVLAMMGDSFKEPFLRCLRATDLDSFDEVLLEIVRRTAWLPTEYLLLVATGAESAKLGYLRQAVLCRFLRATDDEPELLAERVSAVRLLASLSSVQVLRQLERLVSERHLGLLPRHPRSLREAAREVIRGFKRTSLEWNDV